MDTEGAVAALQTSIVDLYSQIEELKQDKRDLRADKDALKGEASRLKDDLQGTIAEVLRLGQELQAAKDYQDDLQAEIKQLVERNAPERSSCSTQADTISEMPLVKEMPVIEEMPMVEKIVPGGATAAQHPLVDEGTNTQNEGIYNADVGAGKRKADSVEPEATASEPPRKRGRPPKIGTIKLPARIPRGSESAPRTRASLKKSVQERPVIEYKLDEAFVLPNDNLALRLKDLLVVDPPKANNALASRECLGIEYGGSHCQFIQLIAAGQNPSGDSSRVFAYPKPEFHPQMPLVPGESGVVLGHHCDRALDRRCTSIFSASGSMRVYLGKYIWERSSSMSAEGFRGQREIVKGNWASEILGEKRCLGEGQSSQRARIALRKAGLLPQGNEVVDAELVRQELEQIKAGTGHPVSKEDIIAAFERGEETVPVTRLRYLSYDTTLAKDIKTKFAVYQDSNKRPKKRGGSTSKKLVTSSASKAQSFPMSDRAFAHDHPQPSGHIDTYNHVDGQYLEEERNQGTVVLGGAEGDGYLPYGAGLEDLAYP